MEDSRGGVGPQCHRCPHGCAELVRRALEGREDAKGALCEAFRGPVLAVVRKSARRREDREDLMQDILLRMLSKLPAWRRRAPFCHYMNVLALHVAIDRSRKRTDTLPLEADPGDRLWAVPIQGSREGLRGTIRLIRAALGRLRPEIRSKARRACTLRRRGMSLDGVAERLGVSVNTIRNWMRELREQLGPRHEL